jgi:hypothetical protein
MKASPGSPWPAARIAERLLAHARLCRQVALECWNEDAASKLLRLADECTRAAEQAAPARFTALPTGKPH